MDNYIECLKKENIIIHKEAGLDILWNLKDKGDIEFLPLENINKSDDVLGKVAYLWKVANCEIGYYYDGLLKGKVDIPVFSRRIFNSIKEYCEYYLAVMSKKGNTEYILKCGMKQETFYSFEEYYNRALFFERDENIFLPDYEKYDEQNLRLCKKMLRIRKYNKISDDYKHIITFKIIESILSLLPDSNINLLDEFINTKENKQIVALICERIAGADSDFGLEKMEKISVVYKKEMEEFCYFSDEDTDPYWDILDCINYIKENRGCLYEV